jgi:uncharacterized protein (TIGR00255 family)
MIRSMTAFARCEAQAPFGVLTWEIRSINHRYLEVGLRAPEELRGLEARVRDVVAKQLNRGKVDCTLRFQSHTDIAPDVPVNEELAQRLIQACTRIQALMPQAAPFSALDVLRWPGVLNVTQADTQQIQERALILLTEALVELSTTRAREGEKLREFLAERCTAMRAIVTQVQTRLPEIAQRIRERLHKRLEELLAEVDQARLEQELAHLAQKMDVAEEIGRLLAHFSEIDHLLNQKDPVGRRLDFLMQELHREANTLGSKSADIDTTRASVDLKVNIEQMREQVQNIE